MESVSFAKEEVKRRLQAPVQIKAEEIRSQCQNNSHLYLVDPRLGFNHRTFRFWINRIPAGEEEGMGWKTLGHRHTVEAVIHVLQGNGHSIIDGVRYDWAPGDFISVPMFSWHRHPGTRISFIWRRRRGRFHSLLVWRFTRTSATRTIGCSAIRVRAR